MKDIFLYNFEEKFLISIFGFAIDPLAPVYLGVGFLTGSMITYLVMKYKKYGK